MQPSAWINRFNQFNMITGENRVCLQLLNDVDTLEDFIKVSGFDDKIDNQTANEIMRLISEMKNRALKQL